MSKEKIDAHTIEVQSRFIRNRNVLMATANLEKLFNSYHNHVDRYHLSIEPEYQMLFEPALAAFTLHCVSRPRREAISWTINFQNPLLNLFLVGDTDEGSVAGRVFWENVKSNKTNSFYQEVARENKETQRSYIEFTGSDPLIAVEKFYEESEQRPAKFFQLSLNQMVILSAHPDYDEDWFNGLTLETVKQIETEETVNTIETRYYRWNCGCSVKRILKALGSLTQSNADALFQGDAEITVNCPRCNAQHTITRSEFDGEISR